MKAWSIDRSLGWFAFINIAFLMLLPLVAISIYIVEPRVSLSPGATEATVGVGVILRAITRRLLGQVQATLFVSPLER